METHVMTATHPIATREEWLEARLELLKAEKALTRAGDELAERRRALPWVRIKKDYRFETSRGDETLKDLFRGNSQLLVYHFMFGPDYEAGCPSCSMIADGFNGFWEHLINHDVTLWAISRAPLRKLLGYQERMGWSFPWASSFGSDFNFDYGVGLTERQQDEGFEYNFQDKPAMSRSTPDAPNRFAAMCGVDGRTYLRELPGMSAFVLEGDEIYHTYSTYGRGLDILWGAYQWLDRAPLGRNESDGVWWKRRDEYGAL
jgi:predicted dithiol-disulfide oxidoreductase (DUF899 family)